MYQITLNCIPLLRFSEKLDEKDVGVEETEESQDMTISG